jgi:NTE family protein
MATRKIGLALGGGGARGLAHIGVLAELEKAGVEIGWIAGTSAGSLVGALFAHGYSAAEILELAESTKWRDLAGINLPKVGLSNFEPMEHLLNELLNEATFSDLKIPFAAVTCDLRTGNEVALKQGNVARAVRASCSIPGIFVPVEDGEMLLTDGGVVNGVPVNVARSLGAKKVVAVQLHSGEEPVAKLDNIFAILMQSLEIMQRSQTMEKPDVLLLPDVVKIGIFDFQKVKDGYEAGCRAVRLHKDDITKLARTRMFGIGKG